MDEIPLGTLSLALIVLLVVSGAFSLAETAMMAANRYRLKHQAQRGARGARLALSLLAQTDKLLGVILLGNNLLNAACATLAGVITVRLFGQGEWALAVGTVVVTFLILVFSEITPKVVGAAHADRLAPLVSFFLAPLLRALRPIVWFVNLFVQALLRLFRFRAAPQPSTTLSQEELRSLVLEGAQYFRGKHKTMLANLMDLEAVHVDDVMTPRSQIHALDLAEKPALIRQQLATSYHTRLPVCEGSLDNIVGILAVKSMLHAMQGGELDVERIRSLLRPPYFIPVGTPLLTQLQQFQADRQRMGLVVDEYGELQGLVTIEDIIEEIIGEFTTQAPGGSESFRRETDGSVIVDGMAPLRTLNRRLGTRFPLDGPKTLNGLIVEQLGDIPDAGMSFRVDEQAVEIMQTQDRAVRVVRLLPPVGRDAAALQTQVERASS
ncbi:MAG TPA: CNNM domain-containing protein [Casimicrobiaceae bacterium]|nr:CNNM domain-containing protein [Casimicrobiaceae bacterium]